MKPKRLAEVLALVASPDFQGWWSELTRARDELSKSQERYDELLSQTALLEFRAELTQKNAIDTLYRAGECEDSAANMVFEATELENRSFRAVSDFEEQRFKVSELWYRLGAAEKTLEERREQLKKDSSKRSEVEVRNSERALQLATDEYEKETVRKNKLWEEVEAIWAKSAEVSLLVTEQRARGKKIRHQAERLFSAAEARKAQAKEQRALAEGASAQVESAQNQIARLLEQVTSTFGATAGNEFLYFRCRDNAKQVYCVSLIEDHDHYNIEVLPLSVYSADRQRGVSFLEPARADATSPEEGDRRFEDYFLSGRRGESDSQRT